MLVAQAGCCSAASIARERRIARREEPARNATVDRRFAVDRGHEFAARTPHATAEVDASGVTVSAFTPGMLVRLARQLMSHPCADRRRRRRPDADRSRVKLPMA